MFVAYAVMFCLAFTAAVLLAPAVRFLAVRIGAVDRPDGKRKIHVRPTPRLGGLVITAAIVAAAGLYFLLTPSVTEFVFAAPPKIAGFVGGLLIILGLGVWDDLKPVKPRTKLAFQTLAVVVCYVAGLRVDVPFVKDPRIAGLLSFPVTWFWLVACINAMNLVDGMDGLAGGVAFFAGSVIFLLAAHYTKVAVALAAAAMLGSVVGFLMYNFHPAVMFLGDSGSLLLGYLIAILAIAGSLKSHATVALLIPILALGLPIMDTLLAILRRVSRRLPISQADREHIHHRLLALGLSHRDAVLVLYVGCLLLAVGALVLASAGSLAVGIVLGLMCIAAVVSVRFVGAHEVAAFLRSLGEAIRASTHERIAAAEKTTIFWLSQSRTPDDVAMALEPYVKALCASSAAVRLGGPSGRILVALAGESPCAGAVRLDVPIALASGRTVTFVLDGVAPGVHRVSPAMADALADTLIRLGKQGNGDAQFGAVATGALR